MMIVNQVLGLFLIISNLNYADFFTLPGKYDFELSGQQNYFIVPNTGLYNQTRIQIKALCDGSYEIGWLLRESHCVNDIFDDSSAKSLFNIPDMGSLLNPEYVFYIKSNSSIYHCKDTYLDLFNANLTIERKRPKNLNFSTNLQSNTKEQFENQAFLQRNKREVDGGFKTITKTWSDSAYMFILYVKPLDDSPSLKGTIGFNYKNGFITANDWPLLPFYAVMCCIYAIYAIVWFSCSCVYWRDLLRLQFWIGGVILLGMIEKAAYIAEYEHINRTGYAGNTGLIIAELISCLKRSLARMLVIIVSLGFGIVKPRLGPALQKVVTVGVLYFVFALVDGVFRILDRKEDTDSKNALAGIPLVVIDVSICYWILTNLQQTMRTLRVRRNLPKLTLYRHFTNTLIFCVIASIIFMIWSLKRHRFVACLKDWKELWLDDGFWHILFSFILLVIIILFRPSNNSQRFLFTPLLDNDDELEEDETHENEVFDTIKLRNKSTNEVDKVKNKNEKSIEDELKWVEENVPTSVAETALPGIVDSDEEVMTTRFEISKMD